MALTIMGQPEQEKENAFRRWQGREYIRKQREERLKRLQQKMKGPQPKTGLRA